MNCSEYLKTVKERGKGQQTSYCSGDLLKKMQVCCGPGDQVFDFKDLFTEQKEEEKPGSGKATEKR